MDDEARAERLFRIRNVLEPFEPEQDVTRQPEGVDYWMQRALLAEQQARHAERYAKRVEKLQHDLARKERYIAAVDLACETNRNMVDRLTVKLVRAKILLNARY